jgi:hypothetical protein
MYSTWTPPIQFEIMILSGRDRRRQMDDAEFHEARQKALLLLTAKHPEHEFGGIRGAAPRHHGEDEAGEIGVVEVGNGSPLQPLRFLRTVSHISHPTLHLCVRRHTPARCPCRCSQA